MRINPGASILAGRPARPLNVHFGDSVTRFDPSAWCSARGAVPILTSGDALELVDLATLAVRVGIDRTLFQSSVATFEPSASVERLRQGREVGQLEGAEVSGVAHARFCRGGTAWVRGLALILDGPFALAVKSVE